MTDLPTRTGTLLAVMLVAPALAGCATLGSDTGAATFYVKDAASDEFDEVHVTFDRVEVHFADNETWVTTVNSSRTVDLLAFNASSSKAFLGDAELEAGRYTQIRIHVTEAYGIDKDGQRVDITLTRNTAMTAGTFTVEADQTVQVVIDVDLDRSLHKQGGGADQGQQSDQEQWRMTPVIGRIIVNPDVGDDPRTDRPDAAAGGDGSQTGTAGEGQVTAYIKDAPEQNFTEVWINVTQVEVHAASNQSWMTVVNTSREIDLLAFDEPNAKAFLGEANLSSGRYTQIRLHVSEAWGVNATEDRINITVTQSPVKIVRSFNVTDGDITQVVIDVNLTRSLHRAGGDGGMGGQGQAPDAEWRLTPVIGRVIVAEGLDDDPMGDVGGA